jgi:lipoate synthase
MGFMAVASAPFVRGSFKSAEMFQEALRGKWRRQRKFL